MRASVYIETAGCAFNVADGETMAGVLARDGYRIVTDPARADVVILNTCTVKDRTFLNFRRRLDGFLRPGPPQSAPRLVVAGCIPPAYARTPLLDAVSTLNPDALDRVGEVVRDTLRGRVVHATATAPLHSRSRLPILRRDPLVEILPIARGCLSACAFCQTRISRGKLVSFPAREILDRARRALDDGVRQLWITGQDTGTWGMDFDSSLPPLLRALLDLPGDFNLRLGMTSPQWVLPRLAEYLDLFDHPRMFTFFHVPIQSGSDRVLRLMRRDGTAADFERLASAFHSRFPEGTLLTDLIAGFPGEEDEDFRATLALVDRLGLPGVNVSRFSARPGTAAARMPPLPSCVVAARTKSLMQHVRRCAAAWHADRIGRTGRVLVERAHADGRALARTRAYRSVLLDRPYSPGLRLDARITGASDFSFQGTLAVDTPVHTASG